MGGSVGVNRSTTFACPYLLSTGDIYVVNRPLCYCGVQPRDVSGTCSGGLRDVVFLPCCHLGRGDHRTNKTLSSRLSCCLVCLAGFLVEGRTQNGDPTPTVGHVTTGRSVYTTTHHVGINTLPTRAGLLTQTLRGGDPTVLALCVRTLGVFV